MIEIPRGGQYYVITSLTQAGNYGAKRLIAT
jgi:hypothetical protein